jgi:hypothetical protein
MTELPVLTVLEAVQACELGERVDFRELHRVIDEQLAAVKDGRRRALWMRLATAARHLEAGRVLVAKGLVVRALAQATSRPLDDENGDAA